MSDIEKINNLKNQLDTIEDDVFVIYRSLKDALDLYDFRYKYSIELLKELDLEKLHNLELRNEVNKLKRIIANELSDNDEYGMEYTGIVLLKEELRVLKMKLSKAIEQRDNEIKHPRTPTTEEFSQMIINKLNKELIEICQD